MDAPAQYALVKSSRSVVFECCLNLQGSYTVVPPGSTMSIRDMQVHVATVYQFWLLEIAQQRRNTYPEASGYRSVADVQALFSEVDFAVDNFCSVFRHSWTEERPFYISSRNMNIQLSPLTIFTHAITHEFHHKGQVMKMARQLGITPPDTDVIRF